MLIKKWENKINTSKTDVTVLISRTECYEMMKNKGTEK